MVKVMIKILLVEDDRILNGMLVYHLKQNGYYVLAVFTKEEAYEKLTDNIFDLILLDVTLPDGDSYDICRVARKKSSHTVVFFLTVKDLEEDILDGYNMGADDYITKPFSLQILMKKIEAVSNRMNALTHERQIYSDSHLYIDFDSFVAHAGNDLLEFTPLEFKFLKLLVKNAGHIVTREKIMDVIWDRQGNYVEESSLNSMVSRIRGKIDSAEHRYIKTVYGTGYMWLVGE